MMIWNIAYISVTESYIILCDSGGAEGFGTWVRVYSGGENITFYDDRNLPMFTTYQYRLTVYNEFSFTISPSSSPVATFGGVPQRTADVSAYTLNHTSVFVNWTLPCKSWCSVTLCWFNNVVFRPQSFDDVRC